MVVEFFDVVGGRCRSFHVLVTTARIFKTADYKNMFPSYNVADNRSPTLACSRLVYSIAIYYPTALRRVPITPKTSTNITRYLYSRGPVRQVSSQRARDELD